MNIFFLESVGTLTSKFDGTRLASRYKIYCSIENPIKSELKNFLSAMTRLNAPQGQIEMRDFISVEENFPTIFRLPLDPI